MTFEFLNPTAYAVALLRVRHSLVDGWAQVGRTDPAKLSFGLISLLYPFSLLSGSKVSKSSCRTDSW